MMHLVHTRSGGDLYRYCCDLIFVVLHMLFLGSRCTMYHSHCIAILLECPT